MATLLFTNATVVLEDRLLPDAQVEVHHSRIRAVGQHSGGTSAHGTRLVDLGGDYLAPGFVDLHVHGGAGHDFMDGTAEAFRAVCQAHVRHGTTSLLPTTTVGRHDQHLAFLQQCRAMKRDGTGGARVLGAHFYGPYFAKEARGCHPAASVRPPEEREYLEYLQFADCISRATVAPELPGAEAFVRACRKLGIGCNAGHSHATFERMAEAVHWGVTHVDHLFCAMSDRARLRLEQTYPMRGGVMEATLFFDELTTEVIADGKHLSPELLKLALKVKGQNRLALCTDCSRALDMPDGEYVFGPKDGGEMIWKRDGVGIMPDGKSLASSVVGMDHCIRVFHRMTGADLATTIRLASLTPARIAGVAQNYGSIVAGKIADLVVLGKDLEVRSVYIAGEKV